MRWRDVLIGAMMTLVVTGGGGVVVFYLTRQRPPAPASERLVYELDRPFSFETDTTKNTFQEIRVANTGDQAASNVVVGIQFPQTLKLLDYKVRFSGPPGTVSALQRENAGMSLSLRSLAPHEVVAVSSMLAGILVAPPTVGVRSDNSIGTQGATTPLGASPNPRTGISAVVYGVPMLALVAQVIILILLRSQRARAFLRRYTPSTRSVNDTAFLYIHAGLADVGKEILQKAIFDGGADGFMLANYGLALGLSGRSDEGMKHLDAAEFYADKRRHLTGVIAFNRGLLFFRDGNIDAGVKAIRKALSLSNVEILRYCSFSTVVRDLESRIPELKAILLSTKTSEF